MDDYILNFIINLAQNSKLGKKEYENIIKSNAIDGDVIVIRNCRYLLGQIIRQYELPKGHRHISVEAKKLWDKITTDDIKEFGYAERINCNLSNGVIVKSYKGNNKMPIKKIINKNDLIRFNDIFTTEHVIPIKRIMNDIINIAEDKSLDKIQQFKEINEVLKEIHTCIITKEEDRNIIHVSNRKGNFEEIVKNEYNPVGIEIVPEPIA